MKAIQYIINIPRYALGLAIGKISPKLYWSGLAKTVYREIPEPVLPGDDWVVIKTKLGGICGTDMAAVTINVSPYNSPYGSSPFVFGHENIGRVAEKGASVSEWQVGQRVVVEPSLWCKPRGFDDLCRFCEKGEINRCERFSEGDIAPGAITGFCRDTGGSWSPYFMAHKSQLYHVPDEISDESAMMIEPFCVALHAVLQNYPQDDEKVLIYGAGTGGLCALAALRALGSEADVYVLGRYDFQVEAAKKLGASNVIVNHHGEGYFHEIAAWSGGKLKQPILGRPIVIGGADKIFDCVGNQRSLDDAMRLTRSGGRIIEVGFPGVIKKLDWSGITVQELEVKAASYYNHAENYGGKTWKTFDLAIDLMANGKVDLGWMVTHKFLLEDYKDAFELSLKKGRHKVIKIAFEFQD